MNDLEYKASPAVRWYEYLIFFGLILPTMIATDLWVVLLAYVCWFGGPRWP